MNRATPRRPSRTWRWPIVIALVSAAGLLSALLGDGGWDVASWFALGLPVAVCGWFGLRRRRSGARL